MAAIAKGRDLMVYNNTYLCLITAMCCFANNSIGKNTSFFKEWHEKLLFFSNVLKAKKFEILPCSWSNYVNVF